MSPCDQICLDPERIIGPIRALISIIAVAIEIDSLMERFQYQKAKPIPIPNPSSLANQKHLAMHTRHGFVGILITQNKTPGLYAGVD